LRQVISRTKVTREQHLATFRARDRERVRTSRALTCELLNNVFSNAKRTKFVRLAIENTPEINYTARFKIAIGVTDKVYQFCRALKFSNEILDICCASGKCVLLPFFNSTRNFYKYISW
jgi:hypothetical protein